MANCADNIYVIYYTHSDEGIISILRASLDTDTLDIALIGKVRLEYGEVFNENCLHLLEHFASPELDDDVIQPDIGETYGALLENPTIGQLWYNTTRERTYTFDGSVWTDMPRLADVAGNSGVIAHGEALPRPQDPATGYEYPYSECAWVVSPFSYPDAISSMECSTDANAIVTMEYTIEGGDAETGYANYQIIAIRGNENLGGIEPMALIYNNEMPLSVPIEHEKPTTTPEPSQPPSMLNIISDTSIIMKPSNEYGYSLDNIYAECNTFEIAPSATMQIDIESDSPYSVYLTNFTGLDELHNNFFYINHINPMDFKDDGVILYRNIKRNNITLSFNGNCAINPIRAGGSFDITFENSKLNETRRIYWQFIREENS